MKIKIFTEGGKDIGLGHISRCCSLYDEVYGRGIDVEFVIYGDISNLELLRERTVINDNWLSIDYLNNYIEDSDYCIVDSYLASRDLYELISDKAKRALYIDDMARISYPSGIIVNPSLNTDNIIYPVNKKRNTYMLGYEYILIRTPFINAKRSNINKEVKEALITMGGSDIRGLTLEVMNSICIFYPNIKFNIIVNDMFQNLDIIESRKLSNTELYYNVDEGLMSDLMIRSDIAITAAGQTIYELLSTSTPFIAIKIIENQNNNIDGLKKLNPNQAVIDFNDKYFIRKLKEQFKIMLNENERNKWINMYKDKIDGLGRKRIIDELCMG
ncbi:MAG: hypothetical protein GX323_10415 [Clostridiales bacterium]|nr:hypothetical protein [Clostridiales bacterium]